MKTKLIANISSQPLQQHADRNVVQLEQAEDPCRLSGNGSASAPRMIINVLNSPSNLFPALLLGFAMLSGCAPITPRLDARFGDAVGIAKAQQTINPEASLNTDPVKGIDGQAGDAIFDNFRNSFRNPQPPMRGVLNLGTGGGGAQGGSGN